MCSRRKNSIGKNQRGKGKKIKKEIKKMKEEKEIITINLATLPLVQQEYFCQRQLKILAKRRTDN